MSESFSISPPEASAFNGNTETLDFGLLNHFVSDHNMLRNHVRAFQSKGKKVVLTSGSFDLMHLGHTKYLQEARSYGDVLVVGLDSDEKIKQRKGDNRPEVLELDRVYSLLCTRYVDLVTLKHSSEYRWELIKKLIPDVLVVTVETYLESDLDQLRQIVRNVVVLEPRAGISTTNRIALLDKVDPDRSY